MERVAIIGAGISGLTTARLLTDRYNVVVFEKEDRPGGLIKCNLINESLFHTCGGHVFNSKRQDVLNWFWAHFSREEEFIKTDRNAVVIMNDGRIIPYPIENHMYFFDADTQRRFVCDLIELARTDCADPHNFEEFLRTRFGDTLYEIYFKPYNEKIWRCDLRHIPLSWLEGKLPMPTIAEIIYNNINHVTETSFVHSSFWYAKHGGSQFIVDRLSEDLDIRFNMEIDSIQRMEGKWLVGGDVFDKVVYCGNIKDMGRLLNGLIDDRHIESVNELEYHGTTTVFCEIDKNPYSWIYLPSKEYEGHRIICTGNFSKANNGDSIPDTRITATIEFTDEISKEDIIRNLTYIPLNPKYLAHKYNEFSYPIQDVNTRKMITSLKADLAPLGFYFTGRFADWEYYNMDMAIGAAMDMVDLYFA
ncbi:MAG: FAD-dependent oxidoreductase [Prevotella sp.]|nr:FAD-dependent oxidoreductase [Prevotella sp.]